MAAAEQPQSNNVASAASIIDLMQLLHNLKATPRTGWVRSGVEKPESIADHMYRMSMFALTAAGAAYDQRKLVKMSIVHDIAEAIVGDIAPSDNVSKEDKHDREAAALNEIMAMLGPNTTSAREISDLWWEYETGETAEAQVCKDFDKLEMILQASEYEASQGLDLQDFFDSTRDSWKTAHGKALAEEIVQRRSQRRQQAATT